MSAWESILLGLVQGLTEFLPVSSSGHLALAQAMLGREPGGGALFEVLLHLGSLGSIVTVFWREVGQLLRAALRIGKKSISTEDARQRRLLAAIIVSAIPAGLIGLTLRVQVESLFDRPKLVAGFLVITGLVLFSHRWLKKREGELTFRHAMIMGVAQAFAILPGISRSGSTITAGLWAGLSRENAGKFAFLMALPPIAGAALLEVLHHGSEGGAPLPIVLLGVGVSYLSGVLALRLLLSFVRRGGFLPFAIWCWSVAALAFVFL
jgi:undecaprenyl-diphosphatase